MHVFVFCVLYILCCMSLPQTSLMSPVEMYDSTQIEVLKSTAAAAILGMLVGDWLMVIRICFHVYSNTCASTVWVCYVRTI